MPSDHCRRVSWSVISSGDSGPSYLRHAQFSHLPARRTVSLQWPPDTFPDKTLCTLRKWPHAQVGCSGLGVCCLRARRPAEKPAAEPLANRTAPTTIDTASTDISLQVPCPVAASCPLAPPAGLEPANLLIRSQVFYPIELRGYVKCLRSRSINGIPFSPLLCH